MDDFGGKVAAITGAGSGIGRALALALTREGARVALADIDEAGLAETARQVQAEGGTCTVTRLDAIARSQRIDPAVQDFTGESEEAFRRRSDLLIQRTSPERAARRILAGVRRNEARVLVGSDAKLLDLMARVLGAGYQRLVVGRARRMRAAAAQGS